MSDSEISFPAPLRDNGRLKWRRSELESYKHAIIRRATGSSDDPEPVRNDIETFVTAEQVTKEFGFGRRTLGRRIAPAKMSEAAS